MYDESKGFNDDDNENTFIVEYSRKACRILKGAKLTVNKNKDKSKRDGNQVIQLFLYL